MGTAYINITMELPRVTAQPIEYRTPADREYTAGFVLRQDRLGNLSMKRAWKVDCIAVTKAQYDAIIAVLDAVGWNQVPFWCDELGGTPAANSITAWVEIDADERAQFQDVAWESMGRNLSFRVVEQ